MPISSASPAPLPVPANARRWQRYGLMLLVLLGLPLLWQLTPQYEVANTLIPPLMPALALALAATARIGWRALPAVAVGAALGAWAWPFGEPSAGQFFDALVLLSQAAFGGLLMRRSGRPDDLALDTDPAIRRLIAVALVSGMMGAVAELAADLLLASSAVTRPVVAALVRGTADAATVLLLVPVILAFTAPQRARWLARRRSVALPLGLSSLLLLAALAAVDERDRQNALARFERDADVVFARTQALLDAPVQAVLAVQGAMQASAVPLSGAPFDALARPWLTRTTGVAEIGWLEAARGDSGTVNAPVRHLLSALTAAAGAPAGAGETLASSAQLRATLNKALAQDSAVVSPVITPDGAEGRTAFVVYQALMADPGAPQRQVVFATVLVDRLLTPLMAARTDALQACLFDADPRVERRRLYGPNGCETAGARDNSFSRQGGFEFAGRKWAMRISQPVRTQGGVWLFALPALAGGGLLAALLLTVTGRVQRIEAEGRQRSMDMQRDIDQLRSQLQRQERSLDGVFDTVQSGLALIDPDGRIQRVNAAFADLVGSTPAELRRRTIDELLQDEDQPVPNRIVGLIQQSGDELQHNSLRLRLAGGRVVPALLTLRVLRERDGRASAAVCALHDLSESLRRRQAERVLGNVLDLSRAEPATASSPLPGPSTSPASSGSTGTVAVAAPQRILCIHADAGRADFLAEALHDRPQVQLRHAGSAAEGLVRAETDAPHLVLLDLALPDGDGLETLKQLSRDPRTRAIPVIVLSDDPRPDRIDAAFSAGARSYLSQPLDARQLLAAIDELI
ncbi:response regulator [Aquabacterium sp.]|uniref:response regulator n=1 Tax=Aquabacterium sp. TaxID=1872578 RepID=UPI002B5A5E8B|nr:response regulator [Aquabacterium sp.]HSW09066.1 response regulator [Aquabacterium sp.]